MRWTWPFNGRASSREPANGKGSSDPVAQPDFLCVGLHKGGTTWLYQQVDAHPDFWMPPLKELHYLDQLSRVQRSSPPRCRDERDSCFLESINRLSAKPQLDFEHYGQLFAVKGALLSGDISPNYSTLSSDVIRRVVEYFPNLKVIFMARDPVERLWSHLSMELHYHQIEPFDVTDIDEINRNLLRRGLMSRSYPSTIVARWKRHVHPDLFRIYFFDDLQKNPIQLRRNVLDFLGADPDKAKGDMPADHNSWAKMAKLPLTDKVRSHLAQFFKKELKTCAQRLGGAARDWPGRYGFSVLLLVWDLLDDSIDLFFWVNWLA